MTKPTAIEHGDWIEDGMIRGPIVSECLLTKRDIPCWTIMRANGNRGYIPKRQARLWFKEWEAQGDETMNAQDAAFLAKVAEARTRCQEIADALDNHLSVDIDKINWADVGDAARVLNDLGDIANYIDPRAWNERREKSAAFYREKEAQ